MKVICRQCGQDEDVCRCDMTSWMDFLSEFNGRPPVPAANSAALALAAPSERRSHGSEVRPTSVAPPANTGEDRAVAQMADDDSEEAFLASLCEQVGSLHRAYKAGQLDIDASVRSALEQARQILAAVRPGSVTEETVSRADTAIYQITDMVAFPAEPEPESPPMIAERGRRPKVVVLALITTVAISLAASMMVMAPNAGVHAKSRAALTSQTLPASAGTASRSNLSGYVAIVAFNTKDQIIKSGQGCKGAGGYSDVKPGKAVTLEDEGGRVIASGSIGRGSMTTTSLLGPRRSQECRFPFKVTAIPYSSLYTIRFWDRRPLQLSYQELVAQGWHLSVTLED
jgi:hypothetical protein